MKIKKNGFTLVEMMVAVAISCIIMAVASSAILYSVKILNVVDSGNEMMTQFTLFEKRLESEFKDRSTLTTPGIITVIRGVDLITPTFSGIVMQHSNGRCFVYWWDRNGNGAPDNPENQNQITIGADPGLASASIYRAEINAALALSPTPIISLLPGTTVPLIMGKGKVPNSLQSIYGGENGWMDTPIEIIDCRFSFVETNTAGISIPSTCTPGSLTLLRSNGYVKLEITAQSTRGGNIQTITTGFSVQ